MAKKKFSKSLNAQIKELSAAVETSQPCAACGKPMAADATTCPSCGTPVVEAAELSERAEESLMELEKQIAETADVPVPKAPEPERPADAGLQSAADVVAEAEAPPTPPAPPPAPTPVVAAAPEVVPETVPDAEVEDGEGLDGFIEGIEAEVGPPEAEPEVEARGAASVKTPTVRAVHKTSASSRSSRWVAPVAAGLVIYVLALFLLALLGRFVVASFMVVATVLVFAGIRARPDPPGPGRAGGSSRATEYVCPLCGTEIPPRASVCPTCGAVFEE